MTWVKRGHLFYSDPFGRFDLMNNGREWVVYDTIHPKRYAAEIRSAIDWWCRIRMKTHT
jgi:hypothetical protein